MKRKDNSETEPAKGTGSAEQTGRNRSEQQAQNTDMDNGGLKKVAEETNLGRQQIATQKDMGAQSGRDDYAGGSGDDMSSQNTGQPTER